MIQETRWRWLLGVALLLVVCVAIGSFVLDVSASGGPQAENAYDDGVVSHGATQVWRLNDPTYPGPVPYLSTMQAGSGGTATLVASCGPSLSIYPDQGCYRVAAGGGSAGFNWSTGTNAPFYAAGVWWRGSVTAGQDKVGSILEGCVTLNCPGDGQFQVYAWNGYLQAHILDKNLACDPSHCNSTYPHDRWSQSGYGSGPWASSTGLVTWAPGDWHYIAVTESVSGLWSFYLDGSLVWSIQASQNYGMLNVAFGYALSTANGSSSVATMPGDYSEAWFARGLYSSAGIAQDHSTMLTGAGPTPVDSLGNGGSPVTGRPSGIAPIVAQTCAAPTDWTQVQQYITWLSCQIQNIMASVLNPVITVLNWGMNLVAWFFDFSRPVDTSGLQALGVTARTRFPFSIPFDLATIVGAIFGATPTAPVFTPQICVMGTCFGHTVDLSWLDPIATVVRWGELATLTLGLGMAYRKWSGGGW